MRVLLADDHKEIRLLTAQQLERVGHHVVSVPDGKQALEAFELEPFDVVLLDEQMPVMGGVQVLRAIRLRQKQTKLRALVVALTGNNSDPDRERLLAAGFDAVIGKPFRLDALGSMLESVVAHSTPAPDQRSPAAAVPPSAADLLQRVAGGDEKLFRQVIQTFLRDAPKRLAAMSMAAQQNDAQALASAAHTLKGSAGIFGAERARTLCGQLQDLGRSGTLAGASTLLVQLKEEIAELEANLRRYAGQTGSHKAGTNTKTERSRSDSKRKTP
jgi:two-component system, sensor histidine kinase and response regulator